MLVLFETAAGYALFEVLKEGKLREPDELWKEFETPEAAKKIVKLVDFQKFENMSEAVASISDLLEGKLSKDLKKFLKESFEKIEVSSEKLAVMEPKIGNSISKKFGIQVVSNDTITELYRGIKQQLDALITGIKSDDISQMSLGLSHSLSRHKLKFSPDKVDNMIIQAIGLLDDLDKELNTYAMRVKEWYGWHFPEMSKIVVDNLAYAKVIKAMGFRSNAQETDLSKILPEDLEKELKEAAEISMGSEISREDIDNIIMGCEQVINLTEYRAELYEYLKNRMLAIAPNLTTIVGELVGARLIAHSGSLLNLAKHPASTVQILGAEKALFRALKTKSNTPKYGLIYHASLVGQAAPKNKGKIARLVATKSSLATRFDALSEEKDVQAELGHSNRKQIEKRIRILEGRNGDSGTKTEKDKGKKQKKADIKRISTIPTYNPSADVAGSSKSTEYGVAGSSKSAEVSTAGVKRKAEDISADEESEDATSEEESDEDNKSSDEKSSDESSDESSDDKSNGGKSKDKSKKKKAKKQKLETEQKKEPSKKIKAKEGKDKKDKKEKKKKKASGHTVVTSTNVVEPKEKVSKKRKKPEEDEEKEISKSEKKAKKVKKSKESSQEKKEKTEEVKPKEEKIVKKKSEKGKQKEKEKEQVKEAEKTEKPKTKKKDKKDKKDKKKAH